MMKTALFISTILFGAVAASAQVTNSNIDPHIETTPATAHQAIALPKADAVIAQFSYLELSHDADGFDLSVTDQTAVFVDLEFPGDLHIRIGF